MDRENFFSKLTPKDYNNELEKILEKKDFSTNVKNLLLSMLYKIEAGYKDYETVKVLVESKNDYIERLLRIIEEQAKQIIFVNEGNNGNRYIVTPEEGKIELFYANEKNLLYALFELNSASIYFSDKYDICKVGLSELLNVGEDMNNVEVLRDFNGWSWAIQQDEIKNLWLNLIYQNLIYLVGCEHMTNWIHQTQIIDYIEVIESCLSKQYGEEITKKILKTVCKLSVMICVEHNEEERARILKEKLSLEETVNKLKDKCKLLEDISKTKKQALKEIREIDKILNNDDLLQDELVKRNEKLPEYNKIFNLMHLYEILNKQRKEQLDIIEENNKLMDPNYFLNFKTKKEAQYELLNFSFESDDILNQNLIIELQKEFIKAMKIKLDNAKEKKDIIDLIYMVRYYGFLPILENKEIKQLSQLKKELYELQKGVIQKAIEQKVMIKLSEEDSINELFLKNLFNTKIIKLENINMEITQHDNKNILLIYDDNVLESSIEIEYEGLIYVNRFKVKMDKVFKLFL